MTPWEATIGTAWPQPTWRNEQRTGRVLAPRKASLSFDGRTWTSVEKYESEQVWNSICRAFLRTETVVAMEREQKKRLGLLANEPQTGQPNRPPK